MDTTVAAAELEHPRLTQVARRARDTATQLPFSGQRPLVTIASARHSCAGFPESLQVARDGDFPACFRATFDGLLLVAPALKAGRGSS